MKETTARFAAHSIAERVGIAIHTKILKEGSEEYLELTPTDCHPNEGFSVHFRLGWRSAEAVFVPGLFSGPLIARMGQCDEEAKKTFCVFAEAVSSRKVKVLMKINGTDTSPINAATWPTQWSKAELSLKLTPIMVEADNEAQQERLILDLAIPIYGMLVSLIGAEENELTTTGEPEGRAIQSLTTRYERSRLNREACIQLKGTRCKVCGFDFSEAYGPLGIGYIEIHHLTPVASIGPNYRIDIKTDLAPVCSNCHSMAHREEPPVPLERLQELIGERKRALETEK
jgi:5-methylcytosine-specific restriction protein A